MAGEDLRRRIFMTESETGESLCLRPEFTIPVCLRHIETATGTPKRYSYLGEVFRQHREGANEFYQAGIEDLGETDVASADARAIGDAIAILKALLPGRAVSHHRRPVGLRGGGRRLGLPTGWQRRLIHAFGEAAKLDALMARLSRRSRHRPRRRIEALLCVRRRSGARRPYRRDHGSDRLFHQCQPLAVRDRPAPEGKARAGTALDAASSALREFLSLNVRFICAAACSAFAVAPV